MSRSICEDLSAPVALICLDFVPPILLLHVEDSVGNTILIGESSLFPRSALCVICSLFYDLDDESAGEKVVKLLRILQRCSPALCL